MISQISQGAADPRSWKAGLLAVVAALMLATSSQAGNRVGGSGAGAGSGTITFEQMHAVQLQYQANLQSRQSLIEAQQPQNPQAQPPCTCSEGESVKSMDQATLALRRRMLQHQHMLQLSRQATKNASKAKSTKTIKPTNPR